MIKSKSILLIFILFWISPLIYTQSFSVEFENSSTLLSHQYGVAIDQNCYWIGLTEQDNTNDFRETLMLLSVDDDGNLLSSRIYSTEDSAYSINCQHLLALPSGNIMLSGTYSLNNEVPYYPFVMLTDSAGEVLWSKKIDLWHSSEGVSLKLLSDGTVFCTFRYNDGFLNRVVCKVDESGSFSNFNSMNLPYLSIVDILVKEGSFDLLLNDGNVLTINNDLTDIEEQAKYYNQIGYTLNKALNGDLLLATAQVAFPGHMTVSRIDTNGNFIWSKYIETWIGTQSFPFDIVGFHFIQEISDGHIVISANSEGGANGSLNIILDEEGNYLSNHKTTSFYNKIVRDNENILIGGFKNNGTSNTSNVLLSYLPMSAVFDCDSTYEYSIAEGEQSVLDPDSIVISPIDELSFEEINIDVSDLDIDQSEYCGILLNVNDNEHFDPFIKIYPNPSSEFIEIESNSQFNYLQIFDLYGKEVLNSSLNRVNISALPSGVYFIKMDLGGKQFIRKIIKN